MFQPVREALTGLLALLGGQALGLRFEGRYQGYAMLAVEANRAAADAAEPAVAG